MKVPPYALHLRLSKYGHPNNPDELSLFTSSVGKSRRDRLCQNCGKTINKGAGYYQYIAKPDGIFLVSVCTECHKKHGTCWEGFLTYLEEAQDRAGGMLLIMEDVRGYLRRVVEEKCKIAKRF